MSASRARFNSERLPRGAWAAVVGPEAAFGAELRLRFPKSLFSRLEARRQYTSAAEMPVPLWVVGLTFGAAVGE